MWKCRSYSKIRKGSGVYEQKLEGAGVMVLGQEKNKSVHFMVSVMLLTLFMFVWYFLLFIPKIAGAAPVAASVGRMNSQEKAEFASFIDGFIQGNLKRRRVRGLVVAAVKDGDLVFIRGYGYADLENKIPVDPQTTLFRVGDISKLLTATAVLQLVESGRLELDRDVNDYLRNWQLPPSFEKSVTLRHLLTHTAGFDERRTQMGALTSTDERGFARKVPLLIPARVFSPGEVYSHSNMGYTLAGSIVERYSRQPFSRAIQKRLLTPLEMKNSGFVLTAGQSARLAQGHDPEGKAIPYRYYYDLPAVGFSSTAADMAKFMIAQLQYGKYGRKYLLNEKYSRGLFARQFTPHPKITGTALGYDEWRFGSLRGIGQNGDLDGFSSSLFLIPEKNFGFFMAASGEGLDFRGEIAEALVARFWPSALQMDAPLVKMPTPVGTDLAGYYRHNRIARSTAEKAFAILGEQIEVEVFSGGVRLDGVRWAATEDPLLFKKEDGGDYLLFQKNREGRVLSMTVNGVRNTYDKLPRQETLPWQHGLFILFSLASIFSFGGFVLAVAINRGRLPWERGGLAMTEIWVLSTLFWMSQIAFVVGLLLSKKLLGPSFLYTIPFRVKALLLIPMGGALLLLWLWMRLLISLFNPSYRFAEKLVLLFFALITTRWLLFLMDWNLLGFWF